jgi:hypothetical protein
MVDSDEDCGSRRPDAEDRRWLHNSDTHCGLHRARGDEEHDFLG